MRSILKVCFRSHKTKPGVLSWLSPILFLWNNVRKCISRKAKWETRHIIEQNKMLWSLNFRDSCLLSGCLFSIHNKKAIHIVCLHLYNSLWKTKLKKWRTDKRLQELGKRQTCLYLDCGEVIEIYTCM